ncbi:MAG TPA: galactitol-1-phosphate 5-dehydrogenase [Candidatus Sulfotelmatobacter sp.]|nr:galactitol-1-phosphate 5-dehydrogenase [Candidatus Sulfotelmatobacter sp.]
MKALLLSEYGHLQVTDVPVPTVRADELLVRVAACGICGSDVHGYDGSSGRRIPPIVMGHEAAGVVENIGRDVTNFQPGDRVTFDSTVYCGACPSCVRGEVNLCDRREVLGVSCGDYRRAGAFAEFVAVPARIAYRLPENLAFYEAAILEAVSVALHAVSLVPIRPESTALVLGAGTIGLLLQQALKVAGCSRVFVTDVDATRLKLSEELGATATLKSGPDLVSKVTDLTNGIGVDVAVEAVGITPTISSAVDCVRKGGTVLLVGNITPEVAIPLQKVVSRQIRLQGSCASAGEYPQAIELMSTGRINVGPLITARAPLDQGPRWFERLHAHEPNLMKIVLEPGSLSS